MKTEIKEEATEDYFLEPEVEINTNEQLKKEQESSNLLQTVVDGQQHYNTNVGCGSFRPDSEFAGAALRDADVRIHQNINDSARSKQGLLDTVCPFRINEKIPMIILKRVDGHQMQLLKSRESLNDEEDKDRMGYFQLPSVDTQVVTNCSHSMESHQHRSRNKIDLATEEDEISPKNKTVVDGQQHVYDTNGGCSFRPESEFAGTALRDGDLKIHHNINDSAGSKQGSLDTACLFHINGKIPMIVLKRVDGHRMQLLKSRESLNDEEDKDRKGYFQLPSVDTKVVTNCSNSMESHQHRTRNKINLDTEEDEISPKNKLRNKNVLKKYISCKYTHLQSKLTIKKTFLCSMCDYKSSHSSSLTSHMRTHTGEKPYLCSICNYKCSMSCNLKKHMKIHTGEKPYKCSECDYKCSQYFSLKIHINTHTGEKPYLCSKCDYRCSQSSSLKSHMKIHTGEKPYLCSICDYRCSQSSAIKLHIKSHTGEKPYKCSMCDYRSINSGAIKIHMRTHTGEKPYLCSMCGFRCARSYHLSRHMKIHTGEKPFLCSFCDYRSSNSSELKRHMICHTGEKRFSCSECDYKTAWSSTLKTHLRTHSGEKPFSCSICDYKCSQYTALRSHIKTHTGEKPYLCSKCDYRCSQSSTLKDHMKIHTGEKPYLCSMCDYKCSIHSSLKKHIKTHTGEKPHLCSICDYRSSQSSTLKRHMKTHTGEKPYLCSKCDFRCSQSSILKRHMKTHTGDKISFLVNV